MGCSLAFMSLHKHIILGATYAGSSLISVHSNTASMFLRLQETSHSHAVGEVFEKDKSNLNVLVTTSTDY